MSNPGTLAPLVDAIDMLARHLRAVEFGLIVTFAVAVLAFLLAVQGLMGNVRR